MKKQYEVWDDPVTNSIIFFESGSHQTDISNEAELRYRIEADTWEEAEAVHYIKIGWAPYVPMGEPKDCPNSCGSVFYPEGSGECPNCGKLC